MSFDDYAEVEHETPYVVRMKSGNGELLYVGVAHVHEVADPQVEELRRLWLGFDPNLALYEGPTHDAPDDLSDAIGAGQGESALVRFLAAQDGTDARSLDPTPAEQVNGLIAAGYETREIKLYLLLRQVVHERRTHVAEALSMRMVEVMAYYGAVQGLEGPPTTPQEFDQEVRRRFDGLDWRQVPETWFDPGLAAHPSWANRVSRALSEYRDRFIVVEICRALGENRRIFAVAGASHVVMQEPALQKCARR